MTTTTATPTVRTTARMLAAGAAAPVVFAAAVLAQAATRPGYDITRHPASILANGDLGWVQIATFLVTGALTLVAASGARRVLREGAGRVWATRLLTVQGLGLTIAGIFRLDPGDGFPAGTPLGAPASMSWQAVVHNLAGTAAFLSMIVLCFVLARRFSGTRAVAGRVCGALFAAGLVWCFSGGALGALTLFLGVLTAWGWIATSLTHLSRTP